MKIVYIKYPNQVVMLKLLTFGYGFYNCQLRSSAVGQTNLIPITKIQGLDFLFLQLQALLMSKLM